MEPRFTRGEYWLLETAVEYRRALRFLDDSGREFSEQHNKVGHRMHRPELIDTLQRLQIAGLISFRRFDSPDDKGTDITDVQFDAALDEGREGPWTTYQLTAEGGRQWESFASPRWNYFLQQNFCWDTVEGTDETPQVGIFTSVESKWLKSMVKLYSTGFRPIDQDSVEYLEIGAWDATYWKVLPSGYRAKVRYIGDDYSGIRSHMRPDASPDELRQEIALLNFWNYRGWWNKIG